MKSLIFFITLGFGSLVFGQKLPLQVQLSERQAFEVYEHLTVPVQTNDGGRTLIKRSDSVECSKVSFYPGDFEYSCSIALTLDEAGNILP